MDLAEINKSCKTQLFKDIISDFMYSFRTSVKNLTEAQLDITLNKIRLQPILLNEPNLTIGGKIKNLVGGTITCSLETKFIDYLQNNILFDDYLEPENYGTTNNAVAVFFMENFFDNFSSISKNGVFDVGVKKNNTNLKWEDNLYYIQYDFKVMGYPQTFKLNIAVDEMTSLYFRDN